jgi:hypothetical protein
VQLVPGEVIFYPLDYWHQTLTVTERSISVTGTLVDAVCVDEVIEQLQLKCKKNEYHHEVCRALQLDCYPWWNVAYKGSFDARPSVEGEDTCRLSAGVFK